MIAYRLFYLTLLNRVHSEASCEIILATHEWKALYCHTHKTAKSPPQTPTVRDALRMVAALGGFLGRKHGGEPGMTVLWRGWNKLTELAELWLILQP